MVRDSDVKTYTIENMSYLTKLSEVEHFSSKQKTACKTNKKHKQSFPKITYLDIVDLLTSGLICVKQVFVCSRQNDILLLNINYIDHTAHWAILRLSSGHFNHKLIRNYKNE